ncbi:MAG TPA: CheR family methyltransferase [Vicinamibacterales bacterium]|nr:CheR family methyltransferase [Vicinamibacterales bacterium]
MTFGSDALGLPASGLPVLRDLIHERTGLFFDDSRIDMLAERVAPIVIQRGFRSFLDLYYLLKYDSRDAAHAWRLVMDALSVPETYFWREVDQIRAVVCRVVPELVRCGANIIRIWSAPCATGEEPLTIAMMLAETGWFDRASFEIHASDASQSAIAKARAGRYRERAFRALPDSLKEKYFVADGSEFVPVPWLSARVTSWSVVNLMAPEDVAPYLQAPIVFCRNAFIYFSPRTVQTVVATYAERMPTPGYLCVGASESLLNATTVFSLEQIDGAFVYVKR